MVRWWPSRQTEAEFDSRRDYLCSVCDFLFESGFFSKKDLSLAEERFDSIVTGYFVLSESYKRVRINRDSLTLPSKVSAFFTLSILSFDPIFVLYPPTEIKHLFANEIFSLFAASGIIGFDFDTSSQIKESFWVRVAEQLRFARIDFKGLATFRRDCFLKIVSPENIENYISEIVESDMKIIIQLINIFEAFDAK